jgi:MtrB/PioB family decaheme-associated outer membrane protein
MTTSPRKNFPLRTSMAAVQGALIAMSMAHAAQAAEALDPAVAALVQRTNSLEVGIGNTSADSYKANEYSGITRKGLFPIANLDVRTGGEYGNDEPWRFRFSGTNLGTQSRELYGEYSLQGRTKFYIGYDELLRNRSDTYQTPLLGAGGSVLTLPGNWLVPLVPRVSGTGANARGLSPAVTGSSALVTGVLTAPTAAQAATAAAIQGADLPAFHNVNLYTKRTKFDVGMIYEIDRQWEISASFRHEDKTGLKPMGTVTAVTGGDISTIIPDLINQTTEQINAAVQYRLGKLTLQSSYYGSLFTNNVSGMTWSNWALPGSAQTISSPPTNQFHQFNLTGSYAFTPGTKLVASGSYARNTQDDAYLTTAYTPIVPVNSFNGLVVTKTLNLKLTSRPTKDLSLSAAYKYDDRDNRSAVNTYGFYDAGIAASGTSPFSAYYPGLTLGSNLNLNANRPYSKRVNQLNVEADYQVAAGQAVKAAFEGQDIDRYCRGSWIDCADANRTKENTLRLEWRANAWDSLSARLGAAHSSRTVDYNEDAWLALVPAAALSPTGAPAGSTAYGTMLANGLTGYGPVSGLTPLPAAGSAAAFFFANNNALANGLYGNQNRISELPGMRRFNMADRLRDKVRASLEWQASEQFTLQGGIDFNRDDYSNSVYGLQKAQSQALNLDASYAVSESTNLTAFYTHEDQRSQSAGNSYTANSTAANVNGATVVSGGCFATIALRNANNKIDPCLNWGADMRDKVDTLGAAFSKKGLVGGKLDLTGSVAVSRARTTNDVSGGNYANNPLAVTGAPAGTVAAYYIAASALPVVTTNTIDLKLAGKYAVSKDSAVRVGYRYQHMTSTDWSYDGLQYGGLAGVLPTNEQAPSYRVHTITLTYLYAFR